MEKFNRQSAQIFILDLANLQKDTCIKADVLRLQTQALAASRIEACKAYVDELPALFEDLENGLVTLTNYTPAVQKRWRQAWRRSWEKAINKAFDGLLPSGMTCQYKGNQPVLVEVEVVKEVANTDVLATALASFSLSTETLEKIRSIIEAENKPAIEVRETVGDKKSADIQKAA